MHSPLLQVLGESIHMENILKLRLTLKSVYLKGLSSMQ